MLKSWNVEASRTSLLSHSIISAGRPMEDCNVRRKHSSARGMNMDLQNEVFPGNPFVKRLQFIGGSEERFYVLNEGLRRYMAGLLVWEG